MSVAGRRRQARSVRSRTGLALGELRRLARLVQAGLLALDLARVAREVALALERHAKLGVGLDERPGDAVAHRAGLAADAAAVHADPEVVRAVGAGGLERAERRGAVRGTREVLLERAAVDPGLAVAGPEDDARDGRLALAGTEILRDVCHSDSSRVFGRLRGVRVLGAGVDLELGQLRGGEPVLRQHALDRLADDLGRSTVELLAQRARLQAAGVAGVPVDHLLVELVAGDMDLLRVDDDHEVAGVDVRRVLRLALAAQRVGDLRREPAEGLPLGVDDVPVALDLSRLGGVGLHQSERSAVGRPHDGGV